MQKSITLLLCAFALGLQAQIKPNNEDWFSYDATYDMLLNGPSQLETQWFSNGHNINFYYEFPVAGPSFFALGLGFQSNNFHNNLRVQTSQGNGEELFSLINQDTVTQNKTTVQYLTLPVELRFRTTANEQDRFFRFTLGAKVGIRVNSYSNFTDDKINIDYNNLGSLNRFMGSLYTRIGYGALSLYAQYSLTALFDDEDAIVVENPGTPQANPVDLRDMRALNVGLSLTL